MMPNESSRPSLPRTIAWIVHGTERYGVRRAVLSLLLAVPGIGWRTVVVCLQDGPFRAECIERELEVISLNIEPVPGLDGTLSAKVKTVGKTLLRQPGIVRQLVEVLTPVQPDALHVLWPTLAGLAGK